jgi:WD40 repeat protein
MTFFSFSTFVLLCSASIGPIGLPVTAAPYPYKLRWSFDAQASVNALAFSPKGDLLAAGTDVVPRTSRREPNLGGLTLLASKSGRVLRQFKPKGDVKGVAFTPDECFLVSAGGRYESLGELNIWEVKTGKLRVHVETTSLKLTAAWLSPLMAA